jgi:hypothetical protein
MHVDMNNFITQNSSCAHLSYENDLSKEHQGTLSVSLAELVSRMPISMGSYLYTNVYLTWSVFIYKYLV